MISERRKNWIILPVLDWFLFSKKQIGLMQRLDAEGDLRKDGIFYVGVKVIISIILFFPVSIAFMYYGYIEISVAFLIVWFFVFYPLREAVYRLPTLGVPVQGVVRKACFILLRLPGWWINYSFKYNGKKEIDGSLYYPSLLRKIDIKSGESVIIIVDPNNLDDSSLYYGKGFIRPCVSKKQFDMLNAMKVMEI